MKRIKIGLYLKAVMLIAFMMFVPLQVSAAEQDQVILGQNGSGVAVSLNMSDAAEENITAVSVSLKVDAGDNGLVEVDFEFSSELSSEECGFRYAESSDGTGRLDIYAVTGNKQSLFREGTLNLGNVKITPNTSKEVLPVKVSYCEGSFQTANAAYGDKTPMVEYSEPVLIQFGGGNSAGGGNSGNNGSGAGNPANDRSGGGNAGEGLDGENTQFKNDLSDAEIIPAGIIGTDGQSAALPDMSRGLGTGIGIKLNPAGSGTSESTGNGKVKVVAPEDGMASILISRADSDSANTDNVDGDLTGEQGTGRDAEEIQLDQKNGGVAGMHKEEKKSGLLTVLVIVAIAVVLLGLCVFLFIKNRKRRRRKAKKQQGKETSKKRGKKRRKTGKEKENNNVKKNKK